MARSGVRGSRVVGLCVLKRGQRLREVWLNLQPGDAVTVIIKSTEVMLGK